MRRWQSNFDIHERRKQMEAFEKQCIETYGFYVHLTPSEESDLCNYHTHGVFESFRHKDLQIVLPIQENIAGGLFHSVVNEIKAGKVFEEGVEYFGLVHDPNMPMAFKEVWETDRKVLRILIPDRKGIIPGKEGCDPAFDIQW